MQREGLCITEDSGESRPPCAALPISQGEYAVAELEALTGIRQPTLSQQLTVLRQEKLVATRRVGKQIFYCVDSMEALAAMKTLYELCCDGKGEL